MFQALLRGLSSAAPAAASGATGIAASSAASTAARGAAPGGMNLIEKFNSLDPAKTQELIGQISQIMAPPPVPSMLPAAKPQGMASMLQPQAAAPAQVPQTRQALAVPPGNFSQFLGG